MRVGIYSPGLNCCGGGEKYIGKIAEILARENEVEFLVEQEPFLDELENRLSLDLGRIGFRTIKVSKKIYASWLYSLSRFTKDYDLFINQEHFSSIPSKARRSISIQEVPPTKLNFPSYNPIYNFLLARLPALFDPELETYDKIVTNSNFTKKWIEKWYNRIAEVLYPPVDTSQFTPSFKENIILSVGRFFSGGHCKEQLEMIRIYKELAEQNSGWEFHLAGGLAKNSIYDRTYLRRCQAEARGHPVYFHVNASAKELVKLYGRSKIFWSATGLGENRYPDEMEHFGITTIEAMSAGCVPVVIAKGGQPEIVRDNVDGFHWTCREELKELTLKLENDDNLLRKMSESSIGRSRDFGMDVFERRVNEIFSMV